MKISFITTVFNEEKTIKKFLDSLISQSKLPDEIVIVDGGSTDKTLSLISEYKFKIPKSKVKIIQKRGNRSIGRNTAIKNATGEIIVCSDAGNTLDKNWIKNITLPFKTKKVDVVAGYYKGKPKNVFQKCLIPFVLVMPDKVNPDTFLPATRSIAFTKSIWKKAGGFDERYSHNEDYVFANRLRNIKATIDFAKDAIVYWIPRNTFKEVFIMFFRFAFGDAEAGILRTKVVLLVARYTIGISLMFLSFFYQSSIFVVILLIGFVCYLLWAAKKNYKYVHDKKASVILPLLQLNADLAVLSGTVMGFFKRFLQIKQVPLLIAIGIFLFYLINGINLPYVGPNATTANGYSLIAHNLNHFGYLETKLAPVISIAPVLPNEPSYYFHHPIHLSFIESVLFKVFGEDFWVGRLSVIIFTFASFLLIYFIGKELLGKKYALIAIVVAAVIPAFTIFGKMIDHEPLVLFYCLLSLYAILKYLNTNEKKYFILATISIILGIMSDWPAVYFIPCFIPLFIKYKKFKAGVYMIGFSLIAIFMVLAHIYLIKADEFWNLWDAVGHSNINNLLTVSDWPLRFIGATFLRFGVYFNPILFIFACLSIIFIYKKFKKKELSDIDLTIIGLFIFGSFHIFLYAYASFTHPYLIYYLLPFVIFGSSVILHHMIKKGQYLYLGIVVIFCLLYLQIIQMYKTKQITSNIWRYQLASGVSNYLSPYEEVLVNGLSAINSDSFWRFSVKVQVTDQVMSLDSVKYKHYVHSCSEKCKADDVQLIFLKQEYTFVHVASNGGEAYLFFIQQKNKEKRNTSIKEINFEKQEYGPKKENMLYSSVRYVYRFVRDTLKVPQL